MLTFLALFAVGGSITMSLKLQGIKYTLKALLNPPLLSPLSNKPLPSKSKFEISPLLYKAPYLYRIIEFTKCFPSVYTTMMATCFVYATVSMLHNVAS